MTATADTAKLWMIRKKSNHIIGPLDRDQVLEMVERGHLEADDELCPENGYWFSLYEVEEVKKQLGIQDVFVRRSMPVDGEATQAEDTHTGDLATREAAHQASHPSSSPTPAEGQGGSATATRLTTAKAAELQAAPALTAEELATRFQRPPSAIIGDPTLRGDSDGKPTVVERSKVWMFFAAGGILLILWAIVQVYNVLHGNSAEPTAPEF